MRRRTIRLWAALFLLVASCSKRSGSTSEPSPIDSDSPYRITITTAGAVSPVELVVPAGSRVLFTNKHSHPHFMASDPHPDHDDCPALNQVGVLRPGESRETGNLIEIRSCGFHDHDDPDNLALRGRIIAR